MSPSKSGPTRQLPGLLLASPGRASSSSWTSVLPSDSSDGRSRFFAAPSRGPVSPRTCSRCLPTTTTSECDGGRNVAVAQRRGQQLRSHAHNLTYLQHMPIWHIHNVRSARRSTPTITTDFKFSIVGSETPRSGICARAYLMELLYITSLFQYRRWRRTVSLEISLEGQKPRLVTSPIVSCGRPPCVSPRLSPLPRLSSMPPWPPFRSDRLAHYP